MMLSIMQDEDSSVTLKRLKEDRERSTQARKPSMGAAYLNHLRTSSVWPWRDWDELTES